MQTSEAPERELAASEFEEHIELDRPSESLASVAADIELASDSCPRLGSLRARWESPSQLATGVIAVSLIGGLFSIYFLPIGIWLGVMSVAALVAIVGNKLGGKYHTLHYQNGIRIKRGGKQAELLFDDLSTFSAEWTDAYTNGVYHGTSARMKLFSQSDSEKQIEFEHSVHRGRLKYEQMQELQSLLSARCAARMRQHLVGNGSVPWTSLLTIVDDGIQHRKKQDEEPGKISFEAISKFELANGTMKIWTDGWGAAVKQNASEPNFLPGLLLLQLMGGIQRGNDVKPNSLV